MFLVTNEKELSKKTATPLKLTPRGLLASGNNLSGVAKGA